MDRNEFISTLRGTLQGAVSDAVVEENVSYYYHYISEEIGKGKQEAEVMELLGDPRLIARTIIDTAGDGNYQGNSRFYGEAQQDHPKGFHAKENSQGGVDLHYGSLKLNTWYGRALGIAIVVLVLAVIFMVVGGILSIVLPVLIPVLLIIFILRILTNKH
ncbi:MAG: hypothetical protein HFI33_00335 [Lachnospiraceae bacterium]|nr:hypothetical protein [Lachnospiraceae bacterium]